RLVQKAGTYSFTAPGGAFAMALIAVKQSQPATYPKTLGNIIDEASIMQLRSGCRASGLIGTIVMDAQRKAEEYLNEIGKCANLAYVWSGFRLKTIYRSEVSAVGNGATYIAKTAPVAVLDEDDFVCDDTNPPLSLTRIWPTDSKGERLADANLIRAEYI